MPCFADEAYIKMMLHAVKNPSQPVFGVLLTEAQGESKKSDRKILDALPLFHNYILSPIAEIAFLQIDQYCRENALSVGGFYTAHHLLNVREVHDAFSGIVKRVEQRCDSPLSVLINNSRIGHGGAEPQSALASDAEVSKAALTRTRNLLEQGTFALLSDFEDHLECPSCDWLNTALLSSPSSRPKSQ